jgi:hypothetical protein
VTPRVVAIHPFRAANAYVQRNLMWFVLGLGLACAYTFFSVRNENDRLKVALDENAAKHALSCGTARARAQTMLNFWSRTALARASHAGHELQAQTLWGKIANEMARDRIGTRALTGEIGDVAATWGQLATDDTTNAGLARTFVTSLQGEYDKTCGTPPTPQPQHI